MPQLDRIIVFTQIFWLFIIFVISYIILTHYFFPLFLKSIKSRKLVVESNAQESKDMQEQFTLNQNALSKSLNEGLSLTKHIYSNEFLFATSTKETSNLNSIDNKLVIVIFNIMLYCDKKVLDCISLNSRMYNSSCNRK